MRAADVRGDGGGSRESGARVWQHGSGWEEH